MGTILVADDEEHILTVMMEILQDAGYTVVGVSNGEEALGALKQFVFDIALIDVMMPKLNGYQLATYIHGLESPPKIVIVTSRNFDKDKDIIKLIGATAFLPKPFSKKDLLEVIRKVAEAGNNKQG